MALRVWLPLNGDLKNIGIDRNIQATFTSPSYVPGKIGNALQISNKASSYMTVPSLVDNKILTAMCWVKLRSGNTFTAYADVLSFQAKKNASATAGLMRLECNTNAASMNWYANGIIAQSNLSTVIPVSANDTWHHLALALDGTHIYSYVDGNLLSTQTIASDYADYRFVGTFKFGDSGMYCDLNDVRVYDHCLSAKEVKEISQGLVLHYKLDNPSITNFSEIGNLIPNYKEMALGSANVSTGTWRLAGTSNMTRTRIQITDSPVGTCYCFQNSGIQTANDGSCYGIDSTTYFEPNTEYRISMFARITSGTEGYAGYNIYNISSELGGSHTKIDKNYRVTPLNSDGSWTYCWYHIKTNSSTTRNIYIGITTGETSVTTQMCLVRIEKWNEGMNNSIITDSSGYGNNGIITGNLITNNNSKRYLNSTAFNGSSNISLTNFYIGNEWSYGCWVYSPTSSRGWEGIIILNSSGGDSDTQLGFFTNPGGNRIQNTANGQYNSGIAMTYGQWNHFFGTFDGSNLKTYINGVLVNTKTITNALLSKINLTIGARSSNVNGAAVSAAYPFLGQLSDIRIYTTALSVEDILDLYHTSANIDNLGGIHCFEINEMETTNLSDFTLTASNWVSDGVTATYSEGDMGPMVKIVPSSGSKRIYHNVTNVWKNGQSYIVSFIAKADANGAILRASRSIANFAPNFNLTTSWQKYYGIITSLITTDGGTLSIDCQTSTNYYIADIKLEEANKNLISVLENGIIKENWIDENNFNNNAKFLKETSVIIGNNFIEK